MSYRALGHIHHGDREYHAGDTMPPLLEHQAQRLLELGVIEACEPANADAQADAAAMPKPRRNRRLE